MTNTAIILNYMQLNNLDSNKIVLHTYQTWKKLGYQVKKGEKSEHKIPVWKPSTKKVEVENEDGTKEEKTNGRYFIKTSAFFTQEQVERIEK
jgi:antirestriction protein ArdC